MKQLNWYGLYSDSWQGEITPEAFSHPAKYSRALIRKIYQHMLESGYIKPGDKIVDPFGGVALGAYHALQNGLVWWGCELEPKFVKLGNENINLWNGRYSKHFAKWGTAVLIQGDSRFLASNIQGRADMSLSSPPFLEVSGGRSKSLLNHNTQAMWDKGDKEWSYAENTNGQLGSMKEGDFEAAITSSPFGAGETRNRSEFQGGEIASMMSRAYTQDKQGVTAGNLAHLETKESDFEAAVSSPPYVDAVNSGEGTGVRYDPKGHKGDNAYKATSQATYGKSNGQLGQMNGSGFEAAVSSSPFEESNAVQGGKQRNGGKELSSRGDAFAFCSENLGSDSGQTFWQAARQIVEQTYMVLKPGAYAAWVTGNFRRNGEIVDFGGQWLALCEAVGFIGVEHAIAWKVERRGNQLDLWGESHSKDISRVSFFRRLDNAKNPGQEIQSEDVWFVQKPL